MTITLAPPTTTPARPAAIPAGPLSRCECGGLLATVGTRTAIHVAACVDCLHADPAGCDLAEITHKTCGRPRPVQCAHYRCFDTAALAGEQACAGDLDACCGCCTAS